MSIDDEIGRNEDVLAYCGRCRRVEALTAVERVYGVGVCRPHDEILVVDGVVGHRRGIRVERRIAVRSPGADLKARADRGVRVHRIGLLCVRPAAQREKEARCDGGRCKGTKRISRVGCHAGLLHRTRRHRSQRDPHFADNHRQAHCHRL